MPFEHEIFHAENLNLLGNAYVRIAARAVILDGDSILLIYSPSGNEYKFPGGGVEPGEAIDAALVREVREEVGGVVSSIVRKLGDVVEYDRPRERHLDLFTMRSSYYLVEIEEDRVEQKLDAYEMRLGFTPRWVSVADALALNESTLAQGGPQMTRWIARDTWALRRISTDLGICSSAALG